MAGPSTADQTQSNLQNNLHRVREEIAAACVRAGRPVDGVRLIAVSKTKPLELIREAFQAGQKSFGENYVQEALEKQSSLPEADWHFIGHLQTNKVKHVIGRFSLIHSVDRVKLAGEIARHARRAGRAQDVLVEINIAGEASKNGISLVDAPALIHHIVSEPFLRLRGLMTLPPLSEDEGVSRGYFAALRDRLERWRNDLPPDVANRFTELSMGTTSDFAWAIAEGATMVRVGTAIFGHRP